MVKIKTLGSITFVQKDGPLPIGSEVEVDEATAKYLTECKAAIYAPIVADPVIVEIPVVKDLPVESELPKEVVPEIPVVKDLPVESELLKINGVTQEIADSFEAYDILTLKDLSDATDEKILSVPGIEKKDLVYLRKAVKKLIG